MYKCSECLRAIGLMADDKGDATRFKCPHTGGVANVQMPLRRKPPIFRKIEDELITK